MAHKLQSSRRVKRSRAKSHENAQVPLSIGNTYQQLDCRRVDETVETRLFRIPHSVRALETVTLNATPLTPKTHTHTAGAKTPIALYSYNKV